MTRERRERDRPHISDLTSHYFFAWAIGKCVSVCASESNNTRVKVSPKKRAFSEREQRCRITGSLCLLARFIIKTPLALMQ